MDDAYAISQAMSSQQQHGKQQQQRQQTLWTWATNLVIPEPTKRRMAPSTSRAPGSDEGQSTRAKHGDGSSTAPLARFVQKAWRERGIRVDDALGGSHLKGKTGRATRGTGVGGESSSQVPVLRRGVKNRILYYIGSFNPPHLGHVALADFVYAHSGPATDFNAVAVIVVAHGAYWIERKATKEARRRREEARKREAEELQGTSKRERKQAKDLAAAKRRRGSGGGGEPEPKPLVLSFERRIELLRRGIEEMERGEAAGPAPTAAAPTAASSTFAATTMAAATAAATDTTTTTTTAAGGKRNWLWVFPGDLNEWWMFEGRLDDACARDGFDLEFVELLGPDYVQAARPQLSGMHGIATSNVCRPADFMPAPAADAGFVHVDADAVDIADAGASMMVRGVEEEEEEEEEYDDADADYDVVESLATSQSLSSSSSRLSLPSLAPMSGFGPWRHVVLPRATEAVDKDGGDGGKAAHAAEGATRTDTATAAPLAAHSPRGRVAAPPIPAGRVWVCNHTSSVGYTIRFVECKRPVLDPDMSSTKLREILAEWRPEVDGGRDEGVLERLRGIALCPELLIRFVKEERAGNV